MRLQIVFLYCYIFKIKIIFSKNSLSVWKLETLILKTWNSSPKTGFSILESLEYWGSSFELRLSLTYIWPVLYMLITLACLFSQVTCKPCAGHIPHQPHSNYFALKAFHTITKPFLVCTGTDKSVLVDWNCTASRKFSILAMAGNWTSW